MYFALAATAGLFASCSSDDLALSQAPEQIDGNDPARIEIGLTPGYEITRGTGMVGNVGGARDAQWEGQKFNVLMLEKGTMLGARTTPDDAATSIIKGTAMQATGTSVISLENDAVYYPTLKQDGVSTGVYDFWGYRLDGSEVQDGGGNVQFNGYDDANATQVTVPFAIDGTQDVMIASTTPSDAAYAAANPTAIYSAKSARNGVKPTMSFKHLLTSLTFKVKAKSVDITKKATNPTTDASWEPGYEITNIQLKSKATGELIVAYTGDEPADRIVWDANEDWADPTTLATFDLQCRMKEVNAPADIKMVQINKAIATNLAYTAGYVDMSGATQFTYVDAATRDALIVYDTPDLDANTGLPLGNKTTLGAVSTYGWILTYNATDRAVFETTAKNYECDYKSTDAGVTSNLVPFKTNNVTPVVLDWEGTAEVPFATANVSAVTVTEFDAAVADHKYTYDGAANNLSLAEWQKTLAIGTGYVYFDGTTNYTQFDITTAYAAATVGANAITSVVGEPMLVAPSNDVANSGYQVIVEYKYWKKTSASTATLTTAQTSPITVNNYQVVGGVKNPGAFEAGKNYNVTITLYSDGEVLNGDADSDPWEDGGDLDAGDDE